MGARVFRNSEAHEYLDRVVCSERDKRVMQGLVAADDAKWSRMAADQHGSATRRLSQDVASVLRICATGEETVDQIVQELRNGDITAAEAAKALGAARRDLNKLRQITQDVETTEEQVWNAVDCTPGEYQERLMRRAPALFREGRNQLVLPTFDD